MEGNKNIAAEDEIDLIELTKTIWAGRRLIIKVTSLFVLLGLIIAFTSKVEYEASCKLLPESQEGMKGGLGGLSGLAGLAGINLNAGGVGVLTPELYPEIAKSLPFQLQILNDIVFFEKKNLKISSFHYFREIDKPSFLGYISKYTIGLPRLIKSTIFGLYKDNNEIGSPSETEIVRISKEDWSLIQQFKDRIKISIDGNTGIISISVEMPDPVAAAEVTDKVVALLTEKVTNYKIDKVKRNLRFIESSFDDARQKFEKAQLKLAKMTDRNKNVTSARAEIELQKLQNEYSLLFEVYKGLASQVEQAKIKLKEETPVFTVLEPLRIPEDKSSPKRSLILIFTTLIGVIISTTYLLFKPLLKSFWRAH